MAVELIMRRDGGALKPVDPTSYEAMMSIGKDDDVLAKVSVPRNLKHHKFLRALLAKVAENHPYYRDGDAVLLEIKMRLGMLNPIIIVDHRTGNARTVYEVQSTSFASMDQIKFREFMRGAKDVITQHILPGVPDDVLFAEILEML